MRFLVFTNHSFMLFQFRIELLKKLQTMGEVFISTPFEGHHEDFMEMGFRCIETKIDRRGINPIKDLALYRFYKEKLQEVKPDIVITYSIKPNVYAGYLCRKMNIPYFVNVQGLGTAFQGRCMPILATMIYKKGLKKARAVFFENRSNADEFFRRGIIPKDKGVILNGAGVNLELYQYQSYPSEEKGIHILYLGRIMKEKGMDETFAAMKTVKEKFGDRVVFDIVGFFEDEYKEAVEKMVSDGIITFHGFQSNPRPYYAAAHAVVLASYHEGMSNVLLEAAATGRALITTDIPGCREAVEKGKTGYLCKKQDVDTLVDAMESFLSLNSEERQAMGFAGRQKMENEFNKRKVVEQTINIILQ